MTKTMFTGIITHIGHLRERDRGRFTFGVDKTFVSKLREGDSVAINGTCLTVVEYKDDWFVVEMIPETVRRTMFESLELGDRVNLERPVSGMQLLDGHVVQGHVDGVGEVVSIEDEENSREILVRVPKDLEKYIVEKGSIAINGISLTVIEIVDSVLKVGIIPHTWEVTMLSDVKPGMHVNLEVDILAKYLEKLIGPYISKQ